MESKKKSIQFEYNGFMLVNTKTKVFVFEWNGNKQYVSAGHRYT